MKNDKRAPTVVWPLLAAVSLLVIVTSEASRRGKPKRRKSGNEEQDLTPQPASLAIWTAPVMEAAAAADYPRPAAFRRTFGWTFRWKGWLQSAIAAIAIALVIVTLSQSRVTSRASQQASSAAKSTAETTARQLELSQRPWISVDASIQSPLTFTAQGAAQVRVNFVIRNVGGTPAKGLSVEPKLSIASPGEQDPVMQRSKVCEENRVRDAGSDGTLFPKTELTRSETFLADAWDIVKESNRTGSFAPVVIVCASYRSTFDDSARYTTGVIYYLRRIDPSHPGAFLRMKSRVEVPREFLRLEYDPIGAIAAN